MTEPTPTGPERLDLDPVEVPAHSDPPLSEPTPGPAPTDPPPGDDER